MISGTLAMVSVTIFQHLNLGYFELIEKCSLPWEEYNLEGTNDGVHEGRICRDKCKGKAFHTNEGKLICFYKKDTAQRIPNPPPETRRRKTTIEKCDCGYSLRGYRRNRMSCNISIPDTTKQSCNGICGGVTVYLFKRQNRKTIVYCEQDTRKEFYEMNGQVEKRPIRYKSNNKYYWKCTCGIADKYLKREDVHRNESSSDFDMFEECADPWKNSNFFDVRTVETCLPRCHKKCQQGYGFYYKDKPFCFHQSLTLKRRTILHGGSKSICECGHAKRIRRKNVEIKRHVEFISCDPPIVRNDLMSDACKEYCSKLLAYTYISGTGPGNIRCISEDDRKSLKPEPLSGKCFDGRTEENEENYTICQCGLHKKCKYEIPGNRTKEDTTEIKLPDLWGVKKKRSMRSYRKPVTNLSSK